MGYTALPLSAAQIRSIQSGKRVIKVRRNRKADPFTRGVLEVMEDAYLKGGQILYAADGPKPEGWELVTWPYLPRKYYRYFLDVYRIEERDDIVLLFFNLTERGYDIEEKDRLTLRP